MIDKAKKKDKFFNNYRIIRSPQSRLVNMTKNSISFNQIIFRNHNYPDGTTNAEIENSLSTEEKQMLDFIKKCLQFDPKKRMTCEEALRHDWFKDLLMESEREIEFRL
jgi:serine/threonine protein kinase